ncbi:Vesicular glutamate transporter 2 [Stylophora pistillata]|uniref:Vesicular glutamate transporter 2 n=1 Tax=Stylophora pistillata TaxID=50429 RepID=A0A2B4SBG6_STYPI|nr:Vesicular glutamate transporter 2 [Stylophora pistillata]
MEGSTSKEKIALEDRTTYDDQLFTAEEAENSGQNSRTKCNCSPFSKRYMISILALLGFANVYALRVNLSVALVAMVTKTSTLDEEGKMLPGGFLALKFGGKNLFGLGILSTAVLTLLTPVAARGSVGLLVALRVLIGLCEDVKVPWKAIFTSLPVWAIVVAHFSENWGFYTLLTELPSFLKYRLDFDLSRAGFVSALPYLVMAITIQTGGHIADCLRRKQILSTTVVRKLFNSFGFTCQGICIIIAGYTTNWLVAVVCLTLAVGGGGFAFSGFYVNHLDIAPPFAGILIGITNTVATLPGIISPLLTGVIVQHQSHASEWRIVFYLGGLIYFTGAIFYCIFSSGNKQTWAAGYSELTQMNEDNEEQMEFIES